MAFPRPRKLYTETELYEYAVGALGRRMRTVAELKRLLRQRVEVDTEIGQTLVELIAIMGYYCMVSITLNAFEAPLPTGEGSPFPD